MGFEAWRAIGLGIALAIAGGEAALAQPAPARALLFDEGIPETPGFVEILGTATLRKGKPKSLLRVDVKLEVNPLISGTALALVDTILVNGHPFFSSVPGQPGDTHVCNAMSGG